MRYTLIDLKHRLLWKVTLDTYLLTQLESTETVLLLYRHVRRTGFHRNSVDICFYIKKPTYDLFLNSSSHFYPNPIPLGRKSR